MLTRRTPLQRKPMASRTMPVRNAGKRRVARGVKPDADALAYWETLGDLCEACGTTGTVVHHILANAPGKGSRRDHMLVVKLCPDCHNMKDGSVHLLGSEAAFLRVRGVDLVQIAVDRRDEYLMGELL
jgi:hypothetical protein